MKTVNFTAYQDNCKLNLSFEVSNANKSRVAGTMLNELFRWHKVQKEVGAKGLKGNEAINLRFEVNGLGFDTGLCDRKLTQKLKFNSTAKSKKSFAQKFWSIYNYAQSEVKEVTFAELMEDLGGVELEVSEEQSN